MTTTPRTVSEDILWQKFCELWARENRCRGQESINADVRKYRYARNVILDLIAEGRGVDPNRRRRYDEYTPEWDALIEKAAEIYNSYAERN